MCGKNKVISNPSNKNVINQMCSSIAIIILVACIKESVADGLNSDKNPYLTRSSDCIRDGWPVISKKTVEFKAIFSVVVNLICNQTGGGS